MSKDEGYVSDSEHETVTKENERIGVMLYRLWKNWRGTPPK